MNDVTASSDDRNLAMLTHLSGILLGFIVPLIIWLTNKDKSDKAWLNTQAVEALNFQSRPCKTQNTNRICNEAAMSGRHA